MNKEEIKILGNQLQIGNTVYQLDYKVLDYITNLQTIEQQYSAILSENAELENKITNLKEVLDKIKEYIKRKDLVNTNEITNGNIKYILELLEVIE